MSRHDYPTKHIHYFKERLGINLLADENQLKYVNSIIAPINQVEAVFCDSDAGTGKTFLAVQAAAWMLETGQISKIIYVRNALSIRDQGFVPGELEQKEMHYMRPIKDSLNKYEQNLFEKLIGQEKLECSTTTYLRGVNYGEDAVLIIDEAQNFNMNELQTILTRPEKNVKKVIIGSSKQVDDSYIKRYGKNRLIPFQVYQEHFKRNHDLQVEQIKLETNYRGAFSAYADKILETVEELNEPTKMALFQKEEQETSFDDYINSNKSEEIKDTFYSENIASQ